KMCVLSWASYADPQPVGVEDWAPPVSVLHIHDAIFYAIKERRVRVLLTVIARVLSSSPVFLHLVHRRHVTVQDRTAKIGCPELDEEYALAEVSSSHLSVDREQELLILTPIGRGS